MPRRFRPPWQIVWHTESVEVQDADGLPICWLYFEDEESRRSAGGYRRMTSDEARRIASNIAKLPGLLGAEVEGD